ncbi:MAG: hypothetical protein ACHREM_33990, partial [Polyangiales bacterium]
AFERGGAIASRYDVPTIPAIVVLDVDGTVRQVHGGFHGADDLDSVSREVDRLLEAREARARRAAPATPPRLEVPEAVAKDDEIDEE